jgi:hypothetical protein
LPRPFARQFHLQAETQKRSDEHDSRQNGDRRKRRADSYGADDVRRNEKLETEQDRAADLLAKAAVHLGLAPPEPTRCHKRGQCDATRDCHNAGDIDAPADLFDHPVETHSFTSRAINHIRDRSDPVIRLRAKTAEIASPHRHSDPCPTAACENATSGLEACTGGHGITTAAAWHMSLVE